ncbi:Protein FAM49A [Tritrichomonas foetus]|uniref:Protein FAM49A n=1 Tax=Tritrichomonas foetus TaxID=1144522 RepID=A0A1J4KER5_9EUKA|nr:Protein FAM49A [Tritrichomonas foetus]|eukprot:OHT08086.1 Protein FAM49A [Tritrichomonas foetus]
MGGRSSAVKRSLPDIYNDLEHSQPNDGAEREIFNEFRSSVIEPSASIFSRFQNYQDGQGLAAQALANPSLETKGAAWDAIYPNVVLQMEVFGFAKTVSEKFVSLIRTVLEITSTKKNDVFNTSPAILKCFVDCFDIILKFDEIKLTLPKLLNDLAFFRRNVAAYNDDSSLDDLIDRSNQSTIFWAAPTPMLNDAILSLQSAYSTPNDQKRLFGLLGNVADLCTTIGFKNKGKDQKPLLLCLRCIVGATLIIDNISPTGAFTKKPYFNVKDAMKLLVQFTPKQTSLINAIIYSSKHLKDKQSDPKVQQLFR